MEVRESIVINDSPAYESIVKQKCKGCVENICDLVPSQGRIQANATEARASVKEFCLNYFWSASSK